MQRIPKEHASLVSLDFRASINVGDIVSHAEDAAVRDVIIHGQCSDNLLLLQKQTCDATDVAACSYYCDLFDEFWLSYDGVQNWLELL